MSKKDEALKLALEALNRGETKLRYEAITAVQEALAEHPAIKQCLTPEQPAQGCDYCNHSQYAGTKCNNCGCEQPAQQQEPVAWIYEDELPEGYPYDDMYGLSRIIEGVRMFPVNVAPPTRKPWVGLTDEEHTNIAIECGCISADWVFYGATVERILKGKNS